MTDIWGTVRRYLPLLIVALAVVATGAVGATLLDEPSADEIVDDVEQRYESADTVLGTVEVVAENETASRNATVEYVVADGNRSRITVDAGNRTVVTGSNDTHAWVYDPATGIAQVYDEETIEDRAEEAERRFEEEYGSYEQFRERYGENVTVERTGTATVDGEETYVLSVTPANESVDAEGTIWVDREDSVVRKASVTGENGTVTARFTETQFNVSVHNDTYRPPTDGGDEVPGAERESYESFDAAVEATDLALPDLRAEYEFEGAIVASYDGTTTATLEYETDNGTAYVAVTDGDRLPDGAGNATETREVAGETVTVADARGRSVAYWDDDGTTTAVIVEGPVSNAVAVAEALLD